jgi:hypothetical protein
MDGKHYHPMHRLTAILSILPLLTAALCAQDSPRGAVMPVVITGGVLASERALDADPEAGQVTGGFQVLLYPSLKINSSWSMQSAVQVRSAPLFYYDAFYPKKDVITEVMQLSLGYDWKGEESSIALKAGKLITAFGAFPLRYSDSVNPLIDQPLGYAYTTKLRPDQKPCGTLDLAHQSVYPVYVNHYCGGSTSTNRNGVVPVTLYGLPGAQVSGSWRKMDARVQLTNSSPANPQGVLSDSQHIQWTAGAGFTIAQGFRVGMSGFKGPFLEKDVEPVLPSGTSVRKYQAQALGVDVQWAGGRWSVVAEWQRVRFNYPGFTISPAVSSSYAELKGIVNPRFYGAFRAGFENHSRVKDSVGVEANHFLPNRQSYELVAGYHLNRNQTIKLGYEWLKTDGISGIRDNVIGVQFVTSIHSLSKAF